MDVKEIKRKNWSNFTLFDWPGVKIIVVVDSSLSLPGVMIKVNV